MFVRARGMMDREMPGERSFLVCDGIKRALGGAEGGLLECVSVMSSIKKD